MNALAQEKSPYLLQHRDNPVNWMPWGEAAFERARREKKPIFLSVGYSTCHWCHVMAHESFENERIAAILNEHFVAVKVDREERPDVDQVYMTFVQATTGQGGWPMSVWLTPELKPIYGGTYFPPEGRWGRLGFDSVLEKIASLWKERPEDIARQSEQIFAQIKSYAEVDRGSGKMPVYAIIENGVQAFARSHDPVEGGFGSAPKFPRPVCLEFLLRRAAFGSAPAREMALQTMRKMAFGGMNDQLGGGFHRYSVDEFWHVPHYEKMLYDQGQLVVAYLEAYQLSGDPFFADVARQTIDYVIRDLRHPQGGFYSAEDADSFLQHGSREHAEGAFYVWTQEELERELGADFPLFAFRFGVKPQGNSPVGSDPHGELQGKNTLKAFASVEEVAEKFGISRTEALDRLERCRCHLLTVRSKRPRPHRDEKILTAWNGLMISGLATAARVLGDSSCLEAMDAALRFGENNLVNPQGRLLRSWLEGPGEILAFAEDYAFWIQGLIDAYEVTLESSWLERAIHWQKEMDRQFWDESGSGYFSTSGADASVLLRMKTDHDGAEPSANSVAVLNLIRLYRLTRRAEYRDRAEKTLIAFSTVIEKGASIMPLLLAAFDAWVSPAAEIVLVGTPDEIVPFQRELARHWIPDRALWRVNGEALAEVFQEWGEGLSGKKRVNDKPAVYVCREMVCRSPVTTVEELRSYL